MQQELSNSNKILDLIFATGIVLTTMTSIRFSSLPIGIGELFLLFWITYTFARMMKKKTLKITDKTVVYFWLYFFLVLGFGVLFSLFHYRFDIATALYDAVAYLFIFILCFALSLDKYSIKRKVELTIIIGMFVFTFLAFWFNYIGHSFYGITLGGYRFTGGAKNPNQLSLFLAAVPFTALYFFMDSHRKEYFKRILFILIIITSFYVGNLIHSQALTGAWSISFLVFVILFLFKFVKFPLNLLSILVGLSITGVVLILNNNILYEFYYSFHSWFNELDEDGSRAFLWGLGLQTSFNSPIFGYGPGPQILHAYTQRSEVHNTLLDILTQSGMVGLFLYLLLLIKAYRRIRSNMFLNTALLTLVIFSISHFVLRQPIFWLYILFFLVVFERNIRRPLLGESKYNSSNI
jgi:O-antigen ligase